MAPRLPRPVLAALVAAAAALPASGSPLPAAQYRARAEAICADTASRTLALGQPDRGAAVLPYLNRLLPVLRTAVRRLDALEPPADLAGRHARYVQSGRLSVALFARMRARVIRGADPHAVVQSSARPLARLDARSTADARALGLPACAQEVRVDPV